ncbi:IS1380 family transposase, partial [Algiphilus sp. W345]
LGLAKVPSSAWLRQRLDAVAAELREATDELSLRLIARTEAPISAHKGFVCCDFDTFVMDQSGSHKEDVGRTYQGVDGYTPIAAYLGNEGWCIGLELRPGVQHSARETEYFLERILPRTVRLTAADASLLVRADSGFDSAKLLAQLVAFKAEQTARGRSFDYLVKWNPRQQDKAGWMQRAEQQGTFQSLRDGKREAWLDETVDRPQAGMIRRVLRITERTIDKHGQMLLEPEITLDGFWTSLADASPEDILTLYQHHGTHEQFHSEIKTDLDLERLPSGKFDTNDAILHLAMFAYNCLRLLGQLGLTGAIAPVRHPAKRRRLKTVLQEIMYRAARVIEHARRMVLDFGRGVVAHVQVFMHLQERLRAPPS